MKLVLAPMSLFPKERNSGQIRSQYVLVNGTIGILTGGTQKRKSTASNQEESFEGDPSVVFCYTNCFNKKVCVLKYNDN